MCEGRGEQCSYFHTEYRTYYVPVLGFSYGTTLLSSLSLVVAVPCSCICFPRSFTGKYISLYCCIVWQAGDPTATRVNRAPSDMKLSRLGALALLFAIADKDVKAAAPDMDGNWTVNALPWPSNGERGA